MAEDNNTLAFTAEIVAAYLGANTHVKAEELPTIIRSVRDALAEGSAPAPSGAAQDIPKADKRAIAKSITPEALVSFIDGKSYKMLKRHLGRNGMNMAAYRERYGLPSTYPSVAPNYSAARSEMAKKLGLGSQRRGARKAVEDAPAPSPTSPTRRGRRKAESVAE